MKTIKWIIAHEPIGLFLQVAESFNKEIQETTDGLFQIEVLSLSDYAEKYNDGVRITKNDLINLVESGKVEMSHVYTYWLGDFNNDLYALDLPYMFQDHDHVDAVLEGEIGVGLLNGVASNSDLVPLGFTYSGGFRIVPSTFNGGEVDSWKGQTVRCSTSPVARAIFETLGAKVRQDIPLETMTEWADRNEIQAGESTYVRVLPLKQDESFEFMNDTAHGLLLTSIVVNKDFFNTFGEDDQRKISKAAFNASRKERRQSVADVPGIVSELEAKQVKIVNFTDEQKTAIKQATAPVYEQFKDAFTPGLVEKLRNAKK